MAKLGARAGWHGNYVQELTASTTLTAADSGKVFTTSLDAIVITLPPTKAGLEFTFINSGADGGAAINIGPDSADGIHGTTCASTNVVLGGVDDKDMINTKGTATTGDSFKLVGDGSVGYYLISCTGIWASES